MATFVQELLIGLNACSLCIILVVNHFGFDGKTVFLLHQFPVISYLLVYYHVGNHIALSDHPYVNL